MSPKQRTQGVIDELSRRLTPLPASLALWKTVLEINSPSGTVCHFIVGNGNAVVLPNGHPNPKTRTMWSGESIERVLLGSLDITHAIASGDVVIESGDYFDAISLSRALRNRVSLAVKP